MAFRLLRYLTLSSVVSAILSPLASAQTPISFADALALAWAKHPASQSAAARTDEASARRNAAASFTPSSPTLALAKISDSPFAKSGRRAVEAELSIPLWNWGARSAAQSLAEAESEAIEAQLSATKLKLAGELREALWALAITRVEQSVAERKFIDAQTLSEDVARRVRAGDLALVDANLAQSALRLSQLGAAQALDATLRAELVVRSLIGKGDVSPIGEMPAQSLSPSVHPYVRNAERQRFAAQSRVSNARAERREGPTISLTLSREKQNLDAVIEKTLRIGVSVSIFSAREGSVRIASANSELAEAHALALQVKSQVEGDFVLSQRSLELATEIAAAADARAQLARDTQALYTKSFQLGETDLPTRLRAEAERFEAERAAERARIEALRATSRLNQAYGVTP